MPPINLLLCSGICLYTSTGLFAQHLPKNPTPSQVIGYQITEQKKWNIRQLPRNSVLYKYYSANSTVEPYNFTFKKEKLPGIALPVQSKSFGYKQQNLFLQSFLQEQRQQVHLWEKQNWWRLTKTSPGSN